MPFTLPRLYVIVDTATLARESLTLQQFARHLRAAGVELLQLRDKTSSPNKVITNADLLGMELPASQLLLNDRVDLVSSARANGVHLGQTDIPLAEARILLGTNAIIGLSTHTPAQVLAANQTSADYLAIGPVFATRTKPDAAPPVGLEGVRRARTLTTKPLVAIGGITRENCRSVLDAGADSIAVISALFSPTESVEQVARDFLRILR